MHLNLNRSEVPLTATRSKSHGRDRGEKGGGKGGGGSEVGRHGACGVACFVQTAGNLTST